MQRRRTGSCSRPRRSLGPSRTAAAAGPALTAAAVGPALTAAAVAVCLALTACSSGAVAGADPSGTTGSGGTPRTAGALPASDSPTDASGTARPTPSSTSSLSSSSPASAAFPTPATTASDRSACASATLASLSPAQRVGQLILLGVPVDDPRGRSAAVTTATTLSVGGYLLYGRSDAGVTATRGLTDDVSARLTRGSAGVAPFVAVDQEGGQIQTLSGPGFSRIPSALQQGALPVATLRESARTWGDQLRAAGVTLDLAPVLDVVPADLGRANQPIGRYDRQFGHTPAVVAAHGVAVLDGLSAAGVAGAGKHFPGLGRVSGNPDVTAGVTDTLTTPDDDSLQPFAAAVAAGAPFMMMSTAVYRRIDPGVPAALSPVAIGLLRNRLHFTGLVVADDLGQAAQVADVPAGQRALRFLAAGGQVVVVVKPPQVAAVMVAAVVAATTADPLVRRRVDDAALQVLVTKARLGLLACR